MSILGALKVQKANQQSIADLAALPQNQIIRLAQMGQIPADVVPVVISEKARMAQEAANLRAAQQVGGGEMPTVIEQAMRANAQQEMPRAAETGVAGIPLGPMFQEKNFKSGGIVAFQSGGVPSADPFESQDELLKEYRYYNNLLDSPADFKKFANFARKDRGRTEKDEGYSDSDIRNRVLQARDQAGALINTAGPSDEMSAGEAEARLTPPTVPLEPANLGLAAAAESQAAAPASVTAAAEPQAAEPADTNPYIQDPNDPSAGYKPGPGSVDMDSDIYKMGMAEIEAIHAPGREARQAERQALERRVQEQRAAEEQGRSSPEARAADQAKIAEIAREFGPNAVPIYIQTGAIVNTRGMGGGRVPEEIQPPAATRSLAPAGIASVPDAAASRQLAESFANELSNLNPSRAPATAAAAAAPPTAPAAPAAPVAPVAQPAAQPPAGLAAALTGRTSTAEGDEGVAVAQEAARRAADAGQTPTAAAAPKGFEEVLANIRRAYGGPETAGITPERKAYLDMLKAGSMSQRDMEKQRGMRFLQAGLGILGGQSPYALKNIAEGSKEALQGYAEDLKAQRTQKLAEAKSAAEIADLRRAEQRQEVNTALDVYGKQLEREQRAKLAAERTSVADRFARNYAAKMQKAGDKRSMEELLDEGYIRYLEEAGQAQERIRQTAQTAAAGQNIQLSAQDLTRQAQLQSARATAVREWGDLKMSDPDKREHYRLSQQDKDNAAKGNPTNLADAFKNRKINQMAQGIVDGLAAAQTRPGAGAGTAGPAKPNISSIPDAPSGSSVGNFIQGKGWEIKGKDGKLLGYAK